jgi:fatty aldehyde-generating acyl-ACP reductase
MGSELANIDFALIGHQESWDKIAGSVECFTGGTRKLSKEQLSEVYTFIPPRVLFEVEMRSLTGQRSRGCYIETFISPDELGASHWRKNVKKVVAAASCAQSVHAKVAALGGFTSIVLEGQHEMLGDLSPTTFTTGNTLTAAFIVKSIEKACCKFNKPLSDQALLIAGATGDIGMACVNYFSGKVKQLLLCARQHTALERLCGELQHKGLNAEGSTDIRTLLPNADLIITITSSSIENFDPALCKEDILICDAGYPKNLVSELNSVFKDRIFCGGMGQVRGGFTFTSSADQNLYNFPVKNVAHGCLLEAAVLSFEKMYTPFSTGRGNITTENLELIYACSLKHGISEALGF